MSAPAWQLDIIVLFIWIMYIISPATKGSANVRDSHLQRKAASHSSGFTAEAAAWRHPQAAQPARKIQSTVVPPEGVLYRQRSGDQRSFLAQPYLFHRYCPQRHCMVGVWKLRKNEDLFSAHRPNLTPPPSSSTAAPRRSSGIDGVFAFFDTFLNFRPRQRVTQTREVWDFLPYNLRTRKRRLDVEVVACFS